MAQNTPPVYQYLWKDLGLPSYSNVVLTLNAAENMIALAILALFITFASERCWIIIRCIVLRIIRPIQLPDPDDPDSLSRLSSFKAARALLSQASARNTQSMKRIPSSLGITAILNWLLFFAIGVIVPYYLTGGFNTAVVRSKIAESCTGVENRSVVRYDLAQLASNYFKTCWYNATDIPSKCSEGSGIISSRPQLLIVPENDCPFPGNVCQKNIHPIRVEHTDLSPREFGLNVDSRIRVHHRLTCAPLDTEPFLFYVPGHTNASGTWPDRSVIWFGRNISNMVKDGIGTVYGTLLATPNGPNRYSSKFSGAEFVASTTVSPVYDLAIYPVEIQDGESTAVSTNIHPYLRRDDGQVFIAMLRAGRSGYQVPVNDPFYAAHQINPETGGYWADYEATALGCVEQYKICAEVEDIACSDWGALYPMYFRIINHPALVSYETLREDIVFRHVEYVQSSKVYTFLHTRQGTEALLTSGFRSADHIKYIDSEEQWIAEIKSWMETSLLMARFILLRIAEGGSPGLGETPSYPGFSNKLATACGRILFLNSDYTNIDFIGLLACIGALGFICMVNDIGKIISALPVACRKCWKSLMSSNFGRWIRTIYAELKELVRLLAVFVGLRSLFPQPIPRIPYSPFWHGNGRRRYQPYHADSPDEGRQIQLGYLARRGGS